MNGIILDLPFSINFIVEKLNNPGCIIENLANYEAEEICKDVGFFSRIIRIKFQWKGEQDEPTSVILKIPIAKGEECIHHLEFAFQREINFYEMFERKSHDFKLPKFYYGYPYSRKHTKGIAIIEDLTSKASNPRMLPGLTNKQVEAVIDELAKINAIAWKNNSNWFQDFQEDDDKDQFMKDMYKEAQGLVKIQPEIFTNILERAKSFFTYETYQQTCYREDKYGFPPGLVHADLWAANIMFARDSNGTLTSELIAIIDWQDVHPGSPCEDIARLLSANTNAEYRRTNTKRLLEFYMERVKHYNNGKAPFNFEQLLDAYKGCLGYTFAYLSFGAPYYYDTPHVVDGLHPGEYKEELLNRDKMLQQSDSSASFTSNFSEHTPRKVFVFRHAERVDRTFRSELSHWTDRAFDEDGKYKPFDLNMPKMLPKRHGGPQAFVDDTPLTELGYFHSVLTGKALAMSGIEIHHVYASPALRSIQTANGIVEGLNQPNLKINVEIGLFEWTKFYEYLARWMTVEELIAFKYHINPHYESLHSKHELKMDETIDDWYTRSHHITSKILENSQGNILIVGHRGSPYSCTTQLCGLPIPIEEDSEERVMKIQYLDGIHIEERENGKYKYAKLPIPRFSCSSFTN